MRKLVTLFAILIVAIAAFSFFTQPAQARRHRDNCGRGFVEKIDGPETVVYDGDDDIDSIFIKTDDDHDDDCQEFYEDEDDGCYDISGLGTSTVTVSKVGGHHCADIDHVEFYTFACEEDDEEEEEEPTPTPTPRPTATPTPTPRTDIPGLSCPAGMVKYSLNSAPYTLTTWEPLKGYGVTLPATSQVVIKVASMVGHPDQGCQSGSANDAGKYPCDQGQNHEEFNVFVDDVQSGFASDHGEDKWQTFSFPLSSALSKGWHQINFRHTELGKPDKQSVDFIAAVCAGPVPTATPQPSSTPLPTASATPGLGKQSKLAVTSVSCSQQNMDAIAELFEDGKPVENVTVKFIYNNEAKFAKTNKDGKAVVQYGYRNNSDLKIEPEQGYPYQLHHVKGDLTCPSTSTGSVLGTTTSVGKIASGVTTGEIKGMAATGIAEDMIMSMVGLSGALFSAASLRLYAKKN